MQQCNSLAGPPYLSITWLGEELSEYLPLKTKGQDIYTYY